MPLRAWETVISHDSESQELRVREGCRAVSEEPQSLVSGADGDTLGEDHPQYLVGGRPGLAHLTRWVHRFALTVSIPHIARRFFPCSITLRTDAATNFPKHILHNDSGFPAVARAHRVGDL
jgi:hypothetical protein